MNPWQLKPWWCQPWSIVLTGLGLIAGGYAILGLSVWWVIVSAPVALWMGYFLLVWPRLMLRYYEDAAARPGID